MTDFNIQQNKRSIAREKTNGWGITVGSGSWLWRWLVAPYGMVVKRYFFMIWLVVWNMFYFSIYWE